MCIKWKRMAIAAGVVAAAMLLGCAVCERGKLATPSRDGGQGEVVFISETEAKQIAQRDAASAYRILELYEVRTQLAGGEWRIDYVLKSAGVGGGPSYVIDAKTGAVVSKRYFQ